MRTAIFFLGVISFMMCAIFIRPHIGRIETFKTISEEGTSVDYKYEKNKSIVIRVWNDIINANGDFVTDTFKNVTESFDEGVRVIKSTKENLKLWIFDDYILKENPNGTNAILRITNRSYQTVTIANRLPRQLIWSGYTDKGEHVAIYLFADKNTINITIDHDYHAEILNFTIFQKTEINGVLGILGTEGDEITISKRQAVWVNPYFKTKVVFQRDKSSNI